MSRSGEQTCRRILDAAYRLSRRKGFTRVSLDDIAAATAVTKRTLYHHFTSKDALRLVVKLADLPGHPARVVARQHKALRAWPL